MILTDRQILNAIKSEEIVITPFNMDQLGSNSYDIKLGRKLGIYEDMMLDAKKHNKIKLIDIPDEGYILRPDQFYLGVTEEYTESHKCVPFIEGKSSVGRLGISIHITAGKGDIGFCGNWTLEIHVQKMVKVYAGMPIGQLIFFTTTDDCINPYDKKDSAKYSNQPNVPVESRMYLNNF